MNQHAEHVISRPWPTSAAAPKLDGTQSIYYAKASQSHNQLQTSSFSLESQWKNSVAGQA